LTPQRFEYRIDVSPKAIDQRGHVNNLVYLQWCLEAAEAHWEQNASAAIKKEYIWYVLSHHIEYRAPAFQGQKLVVRTWVATAEGVRSERQYEVVEETTGSIITTAKTLWCLLRAETQRPTPITDEIRNLFWD